VRVSSPEDRAARAPDTAQERLAQVADQLVPAFFGRHPWLAYERRFPHQDPQAFTNYGTLGFMEWSELLEDLKRELNSIPQRELDESGSIVLDASASWIRAQELLVNSRSLERWDATSYVVRVEEMIFSLQESGYVPLKARWSRAIQLLEGMPRYWETAKASLVSPAQIWKNEAMEKLVDLGIELEGDLPQAFSKLRIDKRERERFEAALDRAVRSTDAFRLWLLSSRAPRGDEAGIMGSGTWENLMQVVSGSELSAPRLKTRLLRDIAGFNRRLGSEWTPRRATQTQLGHKRLIKATQASSELAISLAERAGLFPEGDQEHVFPVRVHVSRTSPHELARLWPDKHLNDALHLEVASPSWSPDLRATRATLLNPRALAVLGLRYGGAGEATLRRAAITAKNPVARFLWNRSVFEGWGLYTLDWIPRVDWVENPFLEDELLENEIVRDWMLEAIRLLACIEIHAEGLSVPAAADAFRRRSGFDKDTALLEARRAHHDPMYGIGYVGLLEMRLLERALSREVTGREALQETLRTILASPHLRPYDVRGHLEARRPR